MQNEENLQKIRISGHFDPIKSDRLYRWIADKNRPINRSVFCRLIGRLIGIGRTLDSNDFKVSFMNHCEKM